MRRWVREVAKHNYGRFEPRRADEPPLETFTWDVETRLAQSASQSLCNILDTKYEASLVFVTIPREYEECTLAISTERLGQLLDHLGIDRRVGAFLSYATRGLHFPSESACSAYYMATKWGNVAWVHDLSHRRIRGIFCKSGALDEGTTIPWHTITEVLQQELEDPSMIETPTLVPWAALASTTTWIRASRFSVSDQLLCLETMTGNDKNRHPSIVGGRLSKFGRVSQFMSIKDLSLGSRTATQAFSSAHIALVEIDSCRTMIGKLLHEVKSEGAGISDQRVSYQSSPSRMKLIPDSMQHMLMLCEGLEMDFKEMLKRAELQVTLVEALISHRQAEIALEVAVTSAEDVASMKTIGMMAMVFLPATYIAALFAMPSLASGRGDDTGGRNRFQTNFWLFLAVLLPLTATILTATWYLNNRDKKERLAREREIFEARWITLEHR